MELAHHAWRRTGLLLRGHSSTAWEGTRWLWQAGTVDSAVSGLGSLRGRVKGVFKENWFVGREVNRKPGESEGLGLGPPGAVLPPAPHC